MAKDEPGRLLAVWIPANSGSRAKAELGGDASGGSTKTPLETSGATGGTDVKGGTDVTDQVASEAVPKGEDMAPQKSRADTEEEKPDRLVR